MKQNLRNSFKTGFFALVAMLLFCPFSFGATFTAVASGNWSSTATWGGIVPALTNLTDQITIPAGITVTMDDDITLNGATSQINVMGNLSYSSSNTFTMLAGSLSGSGTITTDEFIFGAGSTLFFTGSLTANAFRTSAATLQSSADMMINEELQLMSGMMSVQTGGTLSLASGATIHRSGGQLSVNGGSLNFGSSYHVRYSSASASSGVELSGAGLQNVTIDPGSGNTVNMNTNLTISGTLTLSSGTMDLDENDLVINGNVAAGGTGNIASTDGSNISLVTSSNLSGSLRFHPSSYEVNNFIVHVGSGNQAGIKGALRVKGSLSLTSGSLNLDDADLHIMTAIAAGGTGSISASSASNTSISVNTSGTPAGVLRFTAGANSLDDLDIDISGGGAIMIASDLTINGSLNLTAGHVDMGDNMLTIASSGSITGGNNNSYIKLGANGSLNRSVSLLFTTMYPVGTGSAYLPANVGLNLGSSTGTVRVGVRPNVYSSGSSGTDISSANAMVDATWDVQSSITSNLNMTLDLMWSAASEVNGFDRNMSYISHYSNAQWDLNASSAASTISGGMFSQTRANITSLSPFAVFDESTPLQTPELSKQSVEIYPNPATDKITFGKLDWAQGPVQVEIISIYGQRVASYELSENNNSIPLTQLSEGNYFIKLNSKELSAVKQFSKN